MSQSTGVWLATVPLEAAGSPDAGLSAFVGLTGLVITAFLALARLSQRVVDDADRAGVTADERASDGAGERPPDDARERPVRAFGGAVAPAPTDPDAVDHSRDPEVRPENADTRTGNDADTRTGNDADARVGDDAGATTRDGREAPPSGAADPRAAGTTDEEARDATDTPLGRSGGPTGTEGTLSPGALLANVALTQGLFGAVLAGGAVYFGVPGDALGIAGTDLSTGPTAVAVGVAFGVALWLGNELATGVADAVGASYDEGLREMLSPGDAVGWVLLLGVTLPIIAVVEEFIFRAAAVGATTAAFSTSPWAVAVVSSVAFALGHGAQGRVGVAVTGGLGFALAGGFVLTNSLLVVVVAHYLVNALEFAVHEGLGVSNPVWE